MKSRIKFHYVHGWLAILTMLAAFTFVVWSQTRLEHEPGMPVRITSDESRPVAIPESETITREFTDETSVNSEPIPISSAIEIGSTSPSRRSLDAVGGPDGSFYYFVDNLGDTAGFNWIELCGDPLALDGPSGDDAAALIHFGFSFNFYDAFYTSAYVNTNGLIQFESANTTGINECLGASYSALAPVIAAYWDDQVAADSGGCNHDALGPWIRYRSFGTYVVIQWQSLRQAESDSELFSYQALLYNDGSIKLQYNFPAPANPSASIGIDAPGAANGLSYVCDSLNAAAITPGRAVWFYRLAPGSSDLTLENLSPCGTLTPNPAQLVSVRVRNVGSSPSVPTTAFFDFNSGLTTGSAPVPALMAGSFTDITFAQTINLTVGGHSLRAFVNYEAGTPRPNDTTICAINVPRPCAICEPADLDLGDITTVIWGGTATGNCGNAGKWVGRFSGIAGATYHFDLCENPPALGSANFDVDIKITNSACALLSGSNGSCPGFGFYLSYRPNDFTWHCITTATYYVVLAPFPSYSGPVCTGTSANTFTMKYYRTEAVPPPPNDNCANATPIVVNSPAPTCTTTLGATIDCAQHSAFGELWYTFSLLQCTDIAIEYCGTPAFGGLLLSTLYADSCCGTRIGFSSVNYSRCLDGRPTIIFNNLPPRPYWLPVGLSTQGDFCIRVVGEPCFVCRCQSGPNTFCNLIGGPISDFDTLRLPIVVPAAYRITDVNVCIDIVHPYVSDLDIFLISPSGTRVELATDVGGSGDNLTCTSFDDSATTSITSGVAPFSGRFRPEEFLSAFNGQNAAGRWYLAVYDDAIGITGLANWACVTIGNDSIFVPDTVWVDDDWSALTYGDPAGGHLFGFDAFASLSSALNAVRDSGVVMVAGGTYRESDLLVLSNGVSIIGSGPASTFIGPAVPDSHVCDDTTGAHHGIVISANNVRIKHLTIDGNLQHAGIPSGTLNYRTGIMTSYRDSTWRGTVIENVVIKNVWYAGILLQASLGEISLDNRIDQVQVENVGGCTGSPVRADVWGIRLNSATGTVRQSSVTNTGGGIGLIGDGSLNCLWDVHHNLVIGVDATAYQISHADSGTAFHHNQASALPGNHATGIAVTDIRCELQHNLVSGARTGFRISGQDRLPDDLIIGTGNVLTGPGAGTAGSVGIIAHDSLAPATANHFVVRGAVITDYETGLHVFTNSGGPSTAQVQHAMISGNRTGVAIGANATAVLHDNDLGGNSLLAVNNLSGILMDASGNWWGQNLPLLVGALISADVDYTPWLNDGTDLGDPGFHGDFSSLWVDDNSPQSDTLLPIQEAINTGGVHTIHVAQGNYAGAITILGYWPNGLRLFGPNAGIDPCTNNRSGEAVMSSADVNGTWQILSDRVHIDGFAFINNVKALHVTAPCDCVVVTNCLVDSATVDGVNLWRARTARIQHNRIANVGLNGITAGDDAGTPDGADDIVTAALISENCLTAVRFGVTGYQRDSRILRNVIRDYVADSLSAGISGQLSNTLIRGNLVRGYTISAGLSPTGYPNRPQPDSILVDSNVFLMNAAGLYVADPLSNLRVIGNRFSNTLVNALDGNSGYYDSNCWSDFRLNGGYPAQYNVAGSGGNTDYNPNVFRCFNLDLEMSSPIIRCRPDSLARDTLYLTFDQIGFVTGQVYLQLPPELDANWPAGTQYHNVLPGSNASNILFVAARRTTHSPPHQLEVNVTWRPTYSDGDFTGRIACIPLRFVFGDAGQILTISAFNPTFYDYSGPHTTDISVGTAQLQVACVEPPQQLTIHHLPIGSVTLRWLPVTQDALGNPLTGPPDYQIYRERIVPGYLPPALVATVQDTFYVEPLQPGSVYLYEVRTQMPVSP